VLTLDEPQGAFRSLERYLDEAGFWGAEGVAADLFLGYGLSRAIRRDPEPQPPEVCRLPLLACRISASGSEPRTSTGSFWIGDWEATWAPSDYANAVGRARAAIARGDVYQINLVQHLSAEFDGDPAVLAAALAPLDPLHRAPFEAEGWAIVSASPELFLRRRGRRVATKPIKGTLALDAHRSPDDADEVLRSAKNSAEHVMIVDLERNDLARVCEPGSVRWPELMRGRELAGVVHLVSTVEGTLRQGVGLAELLEATFPGGSVTGAPKIAAVDHVAALEPVGRGASMGALGRLQPNGDLDLALTIRTFAIADGRIHLWVGGGVVWDSEPEAELEESWVKARPLLEALRVPVA
jgi:para-aminobenzoate synthetase component 1